MSRYITYKPTMYALIDGEKYDIVSFQVDYELNKVPVARIMLPVGVNVRTNKPAKIHEKLPDLVQRKAVKIYATNIAQWASHDLLTVLFSWIQDALFGAEFLLFDGVISGATTHRSRDQTYVMLSIHHWLIHLTESTLLNAQGHPTYPGNLYFAAATPDQLAGLADAGTQTQGPAAWAVLTGVNEYITDDNVKTDFWDGIRKSVRKLTETSLQFLPSQLPNQLDVNKKVQETLDRFANPDHADYVAVGLGANFNVNSSDTLALSGIRDECRRILGGEYNESISHRHTYWDILVGTMFSTFHMALVPRISDALVVPYNPLLKNAHRTISADEHDMFEHVYPHIPQELRAVVVFGSFIANTDSYPGDNNGVGTFAGLYDTQKPGAIAYRNMPAFLTLSPLSVKYAQDSAGAGNTQTSKLRSSAIEPAAGRPLNVEEKSQELSAVTSSLANKYAKALYIEEAIRNRQAVLQGPWREDIAPGSIIRITSQSYSPNFENTTDKLATAYYGQVVRVSTAISAETRTARTSFHIASVRTEEENDRDYGPMSVTSHPFWEEESYRGATMGSGR